LVVVAKMISDDYEQNGYVLLQNVIPHEKIDELLQKHLKIITEITGLDVADAHSQKLVDFYNQNRKLEADVYNKTLVQPWLMDFSLQKEIIQPIKEIMGKEIAIFKKIPFRMDVPLWTEELALYHQDNFYVKGENSGLTAWIPMQDTSYENGCLSIMPRSHKLGPVNHDLKIGKKSVPSNIFKNEINMVEMKKGDLLLFSALLLHSSNLNLSSSIRYALQPRFSSLNGPVDDGMLGLIPINND